MRVTQNTNANLVLENLQIIQQRQNQLEQQAATGVKIGAPGDDPTTAQQILHLKSESASVTQYARNINNGTATLSMSDSAMSGMTSTLTRVKELGIAMANGTNSDASRNGAVQELQQLKGQMISLGNTQLNGKYIFGGFKNDTPPFDSTTGGFNGSTENLNLQIDASSSVAVTYSGADLIAGGNPPGSSGTDIMKTIDDVISAVSSGDSSAVHDLLGTIDNASSQILSARAVVGAGMNRLTSASSQQSESDLVTSKVLSSLQDVDIAQVVSDLSKQQVAYQTAIAASAKISQVSLLDYLR